MQQSINFKAIEMADVLVAPLVVKCRFSLQCYSTSLEHISNRVPQFRTEFRKKTNLHILIKKINFFSDTSFFTESTVKLVFAIVDSDLCVKKSVFIAMRLQFQSNCRVCYIL